MYYRCQEEHKKIKMSRREGKTEKWMSCGEGSKLTEIKDWLAERERGSNELSPLCQCTAWMVLCKSWVYTHRLPPLGSTHNMRRYFIVCVCVRARMCVVFGTWVRVCEHTMVIPLSYISRTKTRAHIIQTAYIKSIVLSADSKGLRSSVQGVR